MQKIRLTNILQRAFSKAEDATRTCLHSGQFGNFSGCSADQNKIFKDEHSVLSSNGGRQTGSQQGKSTACFPAILISFCLSLCLCLRLFVCVSSLSPLQVCLFSLCLSASLKICLSICFLSILSLLSFLSSARYCRLSLFTHLAFYVFAFFLISCAVFPQSSASFFFCLLLSLSLFVFCCLRAYFLPFPLGPAPLPVSPLRHRYLLCSKPQHWAPQESKYITHLRLKGIGFRV